MRTNNFKSSGLHNLCWFCENWLKDRNSECLNCIYLASVDIMNAIEKNHKRREPDHSIADENIMAIQESRRLLSEDIENGNGDRNLPKVRKAVD